MLYPGEEFSVYSCLAPFTVANGYHMAPRYNNGKVEDTLGGGCCQVSTTLYNALLYAEIEITARSCHSMLVHYVDPSRDAAIAGDGESAGKDLKFKNNTDVPIYIAASAGGRNITFTIYGKAKPAGRTVELQAVKTATISPSEVITKDSSKPSTYRSVTSSGTAGAKAVLYRIIKQDGKVVSKKQINSSYYMAVARQVTVGTKKASTTTTTTTTTDNKTDDSSSKSDSKSDSGSSSKGSGDSDSSSEDDGGDVVVVD